MNNVENAIQRGEQIMKHKKGNVAVIIIITVLVAIAASAITYIVVTQMQASKQVTAPVEQKQPDTQVQPTPTPTPTAQESPAQTAQTLPKSQSTFKADEKGNFYGTLVVTGYPTIKIEPEPFCEANCKKYSYVFFQVLSTDINALPEFLGANEGNSFVGKGQIGIGCVQDKIISYSNDSDKFGMKKYTVSQELSKKILDSTKEAPVTIELERLLFTGGSGAPACYSHFTYINSAE